MNEVDEIIANQEMTDNDDWNHKLNAVIEIISEIDWILLLNR